MTNYKWNLETIKDGIDRFTAEEGKVPTAVDFDLVDYLPSARQIQRLYGGMAGLRKTLGFEQLDFTKGDLRKEIALKAFTEGLAAEEEFEKVLIARFGEPFVHTQKRYSEGTKNRYDFFVYAQNTYFGIDVFTTARKQYIGPNIRHKIHRYKSVQNVPVYFIVMGTEFSDEDIKDVIRATPLLSQYPSMQLMNELQFISHLESIAPLAIPSHFVGIEYIEHI